MALTDSLTPVDLPDMTLETAIQTATENNVGISQLTRTIEHQKKVVEIVARYLPGTFRHRKEIFTLKQPEIQLEDARNQLELGVRKAYLDMINAYTQIPQPWRNWWPHVSSVSRRCTTCASAALSSTYCCWVRR